MDWERLLLGLSMPGDPDDDLARRVVGMLFALVGAGLMVGLIYVFLYGIP